MRKLMILLSLVAVIGIFASFSLIGCKEEAADETTEETVEEAAEETVEEAEEVGEEAEEEMEMTDEPVTINMWALSGAETTIFEAAAEKYSQEHPNVTFNVTSQGSAYMRSNGPIAVASGDQEVDFLWFWSNLGQKMAARGLLLDLKGYHEEYGWIDKMSPVGINAMSSPDGGLYFFGYGHTLIPLIWYHKDMFEAIGADVPTTLEEFKQIARDSIAAGYPGISNTAQFYEWDFSGLASAFMTEEEKSILGFWSFMTWQERAENVELWKNSKGLRDCFQFIADLSQEGLYVDENTLLNYGESQTLFANKGSVMHSVGNWAASTWSNYTEEEVDDIGVFSLPEAKVTEYYGNSLCIPTYTAENSPEKIPVILDFFDSMLKTEYAQLVIEQSLVPGSVVLTSEEIEEVAHPLNVDIMNLVRTVGTESALHFGFTQPLELAFNDIGQQVADGVITIDEAMEYIYNIAVDDVDDPAW